MHFSLTTFATAALIFSAVEAAPHHRDRTGRPDGTGVGGAFAFPTGGFGGERGRGGRNGTEGGRGRGQFSTGLGGLLPFPTGGFPGVPSGTPAFSGIPTQTVAPTVPTGIPDLSSISFELPTSIPSNINAAEEEEGSATTTATPIQPTSLPSGNSTTPPTAVLPPASGAATTTFPQAAGESTLSSPMVITGSFDGGMVRFGRGVDCGGQSEGGDSDAVFQIEEGGTLKNVIIGADQIEGVHCLGSCTIENVWWEAVCEDALTIKQADGVSTVVGGGAKGASDKVVQHNGGGTVSISNFYVSDFGKLYRSCGNCDEMFERHVIIDGVVADGGSSTLVGTNSNYGDTATITNSCVTNTKTICQEFEGNDTGDEPTKIGEGISAACIYTEADIATC